MTIAPRALAPPDVASMLRSAATAFAAEMHALSDAILRWHPAAGEWCVKDVVGHLIEAERRGFAGRIRIILANTRPTLERWDPAEVAKARRDCEKDANALLGDFLRIREESVALVAELRSDDLARAGLHPTVGELTVRDLLQEWVHHDRNHLKQALTNVQHYAWPHMGNAQKFSQP